MANILISACLLGEPVRYDGAANTLRHRVIDAWSRRHHLIAVCPEMAGGLPVPRPPSEITGGDAAAVLAGRASVMDVNGADVTDAFVRGARAALQLALDRSVTLAVLTERSPSCGSRRVYSGDFDRTLVAGSGVTTFLLRQHGIPVFSETELAEADAFLKV